MAKKIAKESSAMSLGNVVGFQAGTKTNKKKLKASQPFEELVAIAESLDAEINELGDDSEDVDEVVKKKGDIWVFYDDKTGVQHAAFQDRDQAWDVQRRHRKLAAARRKKEKAQKAREGGEQPSKKTRTRTTPLEQPSERDRKRVKLKLKRENVEKLKNMLKESFMTYMFEQAPESNDALMWEKFLERLSRETVMSDPKLKSILEKSIKSETNTLKKAVEMIKSGLEGTKTFQIKEKGIQKDKENNRIKSDFVIHLKKNNADLNFSVIIENGRPLIMFPDESKNMLNQLGNDESKLLRAELMHIQETVLDEMSEITSMNEKRNKYLQTLQDKIDKTIEGFNLLEIAMLKYILKTKLKGIG
jgi:hypothetical protein